MMQATRTSTGARSFRLLIYGLILASAAAQFALIPVLPVYAHRLGLSGFQEGMVLAATGLASLAVSVPAGTLSDRFGARRITLAAGVLMAAAMLAQALAGSFGLLLAARLAFGVGYGVVWTAGLCWLAGAAGGPPALGGSIASAGVGGVAGPAASGALTQHLGLAVPLLAAAAGFAVITAGLAVLRVPPVPAAPRSAAAASLRAAARDRDIIGAAAAVIVAGLSTGVCALLVPARLHAAGASPGRIGLDFAAAGILFAAGSALTAADRPAGGEPAGDLRRHTRRDRCPLDRRPEHGTAGHRRDAVRRHRGAVGPVDGQLPAGRRRGRAGRDRAGCRGRAAQRHLGGDGGARAAGRRARRRAPQRPGGLRADRDRLRRRAGRDRGGGLADPAIPPPPRGITARLRSRAGLRRSRPPAPEPGSGRLAAAWDNPRLSLIRNTAGASMGRPGAV